MSAHRSPLSSEQRTREFPATAEYAYLNTATQGLLPSATRAAIDAAALRAQFPDTPRARVSTPPAELARERLAQLLHVSPESLAFTGSTTHGINICAHGIDWRPGDNVVIPEREFPSLTYTWLGLRSRGVEVRIVPWDGDGPSVDTIMGAVDARTRAVSCSAVTWDTGYQIDLESLGRRCAQAGCLLIVDAIQAIGAVDLDPAALQISALSTHGYKWLLSGFGVGALYVAPSAVDQIQPRFMGEQSVVSDAEPGEGPIVWQPGARRYTVGGPNMIGLAALAASLELIAQVGLPQIGAHNRQLCQLLVDGLARYAPDARLVSPADPARRAAIVVFTLGDRDRDQALLERLAERGVMVALRPRGVRVSPHLYSSAEEIERLLGALR